MGAPGAPATLLTSGAVGMYVPPRSQMVSPGATLSAAPLSAVARSHGCALLPSPAADPVGDTKCTTDRGGGGWTTFPCSQAATPASTRSHALDSRESFIAPFSTRESRHHEHTERRPRGGRRLGRAADRGGRRHAPHWNAHRPAGVYAARDRSPEEVLHVVHRIPVAAPQHARKRDRDRVLLRPVVDDHVRPARLVGVGTDEHGRLRR